MTQTEALNLIHEQLQKLWLLGDKAAELANPALDAIKEALMSVPDGAQPEQEPVAWLIVHKSTNERFLSTQPNNWNDMDWFKHPLYTKENT